MVLVIYHPLVIKVIVVVVMLSPLLMLLMHGITPYLILFLSCRSRAHAFALFVMFRLIRFRIASNLTLQPFLSAEEIISCLRTTQGCDGGYPYLVSKSGQEHGFVSNDAFTYSVISRRHDDAAPRNNTNFFWM
jgi:hypothetical protein